MERPSETRWSRRFGRSEDSSARPIARTAQLAALPVAYAARRTTGVGKRLAGRPADDVHAEIRAQTAEHIFEVLGSLRGCAAKLGQIMALCPDGLPVEIAEPYREALARLQHAAPPMLPSAVEAALAGYLGDGWRNSFREFDIRRPLAASIGQVHRAVWHDGTPVAVKIRYPGITEAVESDLRQFRRIAFFAGVVLPGMDIDGLADQVCAGIRWEMDYGREAENQRVFAESYRDHPDFVVPEVIEQRDGVLVTRWLDGVPVTTALTTAARHRGWDRDRIGAQVLRFCVSSIARTGRIYCDPHPGNFLILGDGRLGVVDFGACEQAPGGLGTMVTELLEAAFNGSDDDLTAALRAYEFLPAGAGFDSGEFRRVLEPFRRIALDPTATFTSDWLRARIGEGLNLRLSNVHRRLAMPPEMASCARMMLTVVAVLAQLGATVAVGDIVVEEMPQLTDILDRARRRV